MIIRRRHTANFTTIGNALFNDERLQADEVGIIGYLLSRPHDWEVRRPQLARRFRYGRDAIKRVIFNGMRSGWIVAQKTRLTNGTFHTIYEIRDEPGPELTDEEIRRALSLGSSEAGESESDGDRSGEPTTDPPDTGDPATGQPHAGQPATGNTVVAPKEGATKSGFTKDELTNRAHGFVDVQREWPIEHVLSSVTAEAAYVALNDTDADDCHRGIKPYLSDCKAQNRKVCDLTTFIRERRWERFVRKDAPPAEAWIAKPHTAHWYRWREYRAAIGEPITLMEEWARQGRGWPTRTEWPPAIPAKQQSESAA
jgi:hypothetical protein